MGGKIDEGNRKGRRQRQGGRIFGGEGRGTPGRPQGGPGDAPGRPQEGQEMKFNKNHMSFIDFS